MQSFKQSKEVMIKMIKMLISKLRNNEIITRGLGVEVRLNCLRFGRQVSVNKLIHLNLFLLLPRKSTFVFVSGAFTSDLSVLSVLSALSVLSV
jgi:hypothetical protein